MSWIHFGCCQHRKQQRKSDYFIRLQASEDYIIMNRSLHLIAFIKANDSQRCSNRTQAFSKVSLSINNYKIIVRDIK